MLDNLLNLDSILKNRLIFSLFSLLISVLVGYFWLISREKMKATNKNEGNGLIYLSVSFLLNAVLGIMSIYDLWKKWNAANTSKSLEEIINSAVTPFSYYIISGLISLCLLSALSFFSIGKTHAFDRIVQHAQWKNGLKYFAFFWIIVIATNMGNTTILAGIDIVISVIALFLTGFFIARYFSQRKLKFIALVSSLYFITIILAEVVLIFTGQFEAKLVHVTSYFLAPAIAFSVIVLSYTFNWINELNFYELSKIWVDDNVSHKNTEAELKATPRKNIADWRSKIAKDDIEKVIEEIIIMKKYKNEQLEDILNIASRNTRNNNNHLKNIIKYEDYQLNRNQIANALMMLLR